MPMLKLTISDREPIWISLDKVLAVGPTTRGMDMRGRCRRQIQMAVQRAR